jgi:CRISPR system Cascade subunit CasC
MSAPRFIQIHSLHAYTAVLLNRDDSGLAKRLPYGGVMRTRVSSQCLKRHWRIEESDPHALAKLDGFVDSFRSRELVTKKVLRPLDGRFPAEVVKALEAEIQKAVYGDKGADRKNRQTLLLGAPEIDWLAAEAVRLAEAAAGDPAEAKAAVTEWAKSVKDNLKVLREQTALPGGLAAALFGRMVTSDPAANLDAPIHVAHAFTVHGEETESDYFTAVDDLWEPGQDHGADTIQETELTSGLFYGYVVVDLPLLIDNCGGDAALAGRVVEHLVHLVAEVSPGAKLGSTAPYGRAGLMLIEAGDRQPRSLAGAFRTALSGSDLDQAITALDDELSRMDRAYETGEARCHLSLGVALAAGGEQGSLRTIASWAGERVVDAAPGAAA